MIKAIIESEVKQAALDILSAQGHGGCPWPELGLFPFAKVDGRRADGGRLINVAL